MKPAPFELMQPSSVMEAISILADQPDETVILAGGQSLVPLMNMRLAVADRVLDLNGIDSLDYVELDSGVLAVGAMTRHRRVELADVVAQHCPVLATAESHVGYVGIRNRGTVGGSIAHADTVAELTCVAVALDATVVLDSARGKRELKTAEFLVGNLMNAREPDELLVEVRFPMQPTNATSGFAEFARKVGDFPLVTATAQIVRDGQLCQAANLAVGGATPVPVRLPDCESSLVGSDLTDDLLREIGDQARVSLQPELGRSASEQYRGVLVAEVARRALARALGHAAEEVWEE